MSKIIIISTLLISYMGNRVIAQPLKQGDLSPQFETIDVFGEQVRVSSDNDSKIFIAFMRYAGCPVCNFRTHELIESHTQLQALGYKVILVSESNPETVRKYLQESPVPFHVIADPKKNLFKQFKVQASFWKTLKSAMNKKTNTSKKAGNKLFENNKIKRDGKLTGIPADFIISVNGRIERAYYGKNIADHLPLNEIIK